MEKILLRSERYSGKYVALKSTSDDTVVGSGNAPEEALREARAAGHDSPVLFYVPEKKSIHIY